MNHSNVNIFWAGFCFGMFFGIICTMIGFIVLSGRGITEKTAVEKGAAIYRIKPGTLNEVEFVWKSDLND